MTFFSGVNPVIDPLTYSLSNDGLGPLHELHMPKNLLQLLVAQTMAGASESLPMSNESVTSSMMHTVASAEATFKSTEGNSWLRHDRSARFSRSCSPGKCWTSTVTESKYRPHRISLRLLRYRSSMARPENFLSSLTRARCCAAATTAAARRRRLISPSNIAHSLSCTSLSFFYREVVLTSRDAALSVCNAQTALCFFLAYS